MAEKIELILLQKPIGPRNSIWKVLLRAMTPDS